MWATIVLGVVLGSVPNQNGDLKLTNIHASNGPFGLGREEATNPLELLPGDNYYVNFEAENLQMAKDGIVNYSMAFEVVDPKGATITKVGPKTMKAALSLGAARMPLFAISSVDKNAPPGNYTMKVTVADLAKSNKPQSFSRTFKVKKMEFGIVRPQLSFFSEKDVYLVGPVGVVSQTFVASCAAVGFGKDPKTKQPKVKVTIRILDEKGTPTIDPATKIFDAGFPDDTDAIPIDYPIDCTRPGKFKVEIAVEDLIGSKTDKITYPITVYGLK